MAGTPAELEAAIKARSQSTAPFYAAAARDSAPIDNEMVALMQRPSMQAAIAKARQLADERGESFGIGSNGTQLSLSGRDLQGIKMALDDMKSTSFTQGIGSHQAAAMQDTLDELKSWMQRNVPAQRAADAAFQNLSVPINRMETLQELQQKASLTSADITTQQPFLSTAKFVNGLSDIKANPRSGLSMLDMMRLSAIQKDLQNSQSPVALRAPGSDTFQNLSLNQNLGSGAKFAAKALEVPYRLAGADSAINELLTKAFLDPKLAATFMKRAQVPLSDTNFRPYDLGTLGYLSGSDRR
jgi:hypothetical protein